MCLSTDARPRDVEATRKVLIHTVGGMRRKRADQLNDRKRATPVRSRSPGAPVIRWHRAQRDRTGACSIRDRTRLHPPSRLKEKAQRGDITGPRIGDLRLSSDFPGVGAQEIALRPTIRARKVVVEPRHGPIHASALRSPRHGRSLDRASMLMRMPRPVLQPPNEATSARDRVCSG